MAEKNSIISRLKNNVIEGKGISKDEALFLIEVDLNELGKAANEIRIKFCGNKFEICSIINAKSGRCSEDCKYCAQSSHYKVDIKQYPLLESEKILYAAKKDDMEGVQRFSLVTSGRKLSEKEIDNLCESINKIKLQTNLKICASCGLLNSADLTKLKDAGLSRYHNNIESSQKFFRQVCSTHTTEDKIATINAAQNLGIEICSGGIIGLGESWEDRIEMAFLLNQLGAISIPINILNPISGTPYENNKVIDNDEICRVCAIFRFINPKSFIRLAGGRCLLNDKGKRCFQFGANALISGNMLTTVGTTIQQDLEMITELGFYIEK